MGCGSRPLFRFRAVFGGGGAGLPDRRAGDGGGGSGADGVLCLQPLRGDGGQRRNRRQRQPVHGKGKRRHRAVLLRARYYDPVLKRFIGEDPIGLAGGVNQYAYVWNDPLRYIDPRGNQATTLGGLGGTGSLGGLGAFTNGLSRFGPLGLIFYPCDAAPPDEEDCVQEWEDAYRICRELMYEELQQRAGRRKKRSVRGVIGPSNDLEMCARGLVSERCGGNKVQ